MRTQFWREQNNARAQNKERILSIKFPRTLTNFWLVNNTYFIPEQEHYYLFMPFFFTKRI